MYWLQKEENLKAAQKFGYGKDHLKCKDIGHVWISQFDNEKYDMHFFCYNCSIENKEKGYHVFSVPPSIPVHLYKAYGAVT